MRILIALCGFIALVSCEIASSDKYEMSVLIKERFSLKIFFNENLFLFFCFVIRGKNRHHYQHEQSVSAAKQSLQERLALLQGQSGYSANQARYGNAYGSSGSQKYVSGCSSCLVGSENRESYSSRYSSSMRRLL